MHRALASYSSGAGGTEADELIGKYSSVIDRIVRRIVMRTGLHSALDDLWSAGALGLLEAAGRFDAARGVTFETFVEHRIRGAMMDELRRMDHLPRRLRSRTDDVQKARHKLSAELGRTASSEEVAGEMKIDVEELSGIEALLEPHVPLDKVAHTVAAHDDGGAPGSATIENDIMRAQTAKALAAHFKTLPERLQTV